MSKVVELLHQSADVMILTPALRTAGNIVTGSDSQTEAMINLGLLNVFPKLLRHNKPNIVKVRDEIYGPKRLKSDRTKLRGLKLTQLLGSSLDNFQYNSWNYPSDRKSSPAWTVGWFSQCSKSWRVQSQKRSNLGCNKSYIRWKTTSNDEINWTWSHWATYFNAWL